MPGIAERHDIHPNSLKAYGSINIPDKNYKVFVVYDRNDRPLTDREAKNLGFFQDMNDVRPRVTEMLSPATRGEEPLLRVFDHVTCPVTHKRVRRCVVNHRENPQFKFF